MNRPLISRPWWRLPLVVWCLIGYWLVLAAGTHAPPRSVPRAASLAWDKAVHTAAYAVLAMLTGLSASALAERRVGPPDRPARLARRNATLLVLLTAYGLLDEATQPLTGRTFEWQDWAANGLGVALGLAVHTVYGVWRLRRRGGQGGSIRPAAEEIAA